MFSITPADDKLPEKDEQFIIGIMILSDGVLDANSTTMGAIVNTSQWQCRVTITQNDYPFGVLQLMGHIPRTFIHPLSDPVNISVEEKFSDINIYIIRAQGTEGIRFLMQLFYLSIIPAQGLKCISIISVDINL